MCERERRRGEGGGSRRGIEGKEERGRKKKKERGGGEVYKRRGRGEGIKVKLVEVYKKGRR